MTLFWTRYRDYNVSQNLRVATEELSCGGETFDFGATQKRRHIAALSTPFHPPVVRLCCRARTA